MTTDNEVPKHDPALIVFGKRSVWLVLFVQAIVFSLTHSEVSFAQSPPGFPGALTEGTAYVPGEVLVKFKGTVALAEKDRLHSEAGVDRLSEIPRLGVERVRSRRGESTEALLNRYKESPLIEYVEPNGLFRAESVPNDPMLTFLYGLFNVHAVEAWDLQTGSAGVVVADIDSGVDYNHEDLAANIWTNPGEIPNNGIDDDGNGYVDDVRGWNFVSNNNSPYDDLGHGTHTAGTIAAIGNNGLGVVGVTWTSKIMPLKFLNAQNVGSWADAALAITYAADKGVKISNNSYGCLVPGVGCFSQTVEDAIAYANTKGMLFVVAAMNNSNDNDASVMYPCNSIQPNVICVAATDENDQKAGFSNYGATTVDLGAPGVNIRSTTPGNTYSFYNGTSMATPHVSGAAALLLAEAPSLTVAQLKAAILDNVDPVAALAGLTVTGGRLNVDKALQSVHSQLISISSRAYVGTGANVLIGGIWISGSSPKTVTIRARGPSMGGAPFFVPGTLANPKVQLYSGSTVIASQDDWQTAPTCVGYSCSGPPTGVDPCQPNPGQTVPPPNCALEAAFQITLPPGGYTAIVSGVGGGVGVGLVEVFDASP